MKTAKEIKDYIINYLNVSIKHHNELMEENAKNRNFYYADRHKSFRDMYIADKCQIEADFKEI